MLKKEGITVTLEEADGILVFLRKLANLAVVNYLKNKDSIPKENIVSTTNKKNKLKAILKTIVKYRKPCNF
jgi:hypothetical protein